MNATSQFDQDDEITLIDVVNFFKKYLIVLVTASFLGLAIAYFSQFAFPIKNQASALIASAKISGNPLQDSNQLLASMRMADFFDDNTIKGCSANGVIQSTLALRENLSLTPTDSPALISLNYQSLIAGDVDPCMHVVLESVKRYQKPMFLAAKMKLSEQISELMVSLQVVEERYRRLRSISEQQIVDLSNELNATNSILSLINSRILNAPSGDVDSSGAIMLLFLLESQQQRARFKNNDIFTLKEKMLSFEIEYEKQISDLKENILNAENNLMVPLTKEAHFLGPVTISSSRVGPSSKLLAFAGLIIFGGLALVGCLFQASYASAVTRVKKSKKVT